MRILNRKIWTTINLAYEAYQSFPDLDNLEIVTSVSTNTGVDYFIAKKNDTYFLSFAGTNDWKNLVSDMRFWQKSIPYNNKQTTIRLHRGFYEAYLTVRKDILDFVEKNNVKKIILTGHSFGAAMATLCAVDIQYNIFGVKIEVFTYGSPRIGNKAFAKSFNRRIPKAFKIKNGNDFISNLPFKFLNYSHIGKEIHIGDKKKIWKISFKDHKCKNYLISVIKLLPWSERGRDV